MYLMFKHFEEYTIFTIICRLTVIRQFVSGCCNVRFRGRSRAFPQVPRKRSLWYRQTGPGRKAAAVSWESETLSGAHAERPKTSCWRQVLKSGKVEQKQGNLGNNAEMIKTPATMIPF